MVERDEPACQTEACNLFTVPMSLAGDMYVQRGKTAAGTQRYRCNACSKTFSGSGKSTKKHRMPHKNREVFSLLINKMPLRRIAEVTGLDLDEVDADAVRLGDTGLSQPYRRYARLWLRTDYDAAVAEAKERKAAKTPKRLGAYEPDPLGAAIAESYAEAAVRDDVEAVVMLDSDQTLPTTGVEVRDQYTVYAHFLMIERLLRHAPKVRCYMDQDSGFRAAFMSAFNAQVKERRADAWFVKVMKESTIDAKRAAVGEAKKRLAKAIVELTSKDGPPTEREAQVQMTLSEMGRMAPLGKWDDRWLTHPVPNMAEPDKRLCWLTDIDQPETDADLLADQRRHAARLYLRGSLHAVDRFFMRVRHSLTLAERPYATASSDRRMWHGYSAYAPRNLAMVLVIFKVAYNYCLTDSKGETPAMKLGLAKGPVALEDIVYFAS